MAMKKLLALLLISPPCFASVPIVTLEFLQERVTIEKEAGKTLYTVKNLDGKLVAEKLSIEDLQAQRPEIYKHLKQGIAPVVQSEWPYYIDASK